MRTIRLWILYAIANIEVYCLAIKYYALQGCYDWNFALHRAEWMMGGKRAY